MNTTKHTPGPWIAGRTSRGNWSVWTKQSMYNVLDYSAPISDDGCEANARLIAAAPELLENAKAALAALDQAKTFPADIEAAKLFLRGAIAKAAQG